MTARRDAGLCFLMHGHWCVPSHRRVRFNQWGVICNALHVFVGVVVATALSLIIHTPFLVVTVFSGGCREVFQGAGSPSPGFVLLYSP